MHSMTGYGRGQAEIDGQTLTLEVSSVNRRNLETSHSLPREWQGMERLVTEAVRARCQRGKFHVQIQVKRVAEVSVADWDAEAMLARHAALNAIAESAGSTFAADASYWLRLADQSAGAREECGWEAAWLVVEPVLSAALDGLLGMRVTEGQSLAEDITARLDHLQAWRGEIEALARDTVPRYRELLLERLKKAGLEMSLDDDRVLKELALFADRCDIAEELTRLDSHLGQFRETMNEAGAIGRKLDFLCQEINREVNTIGSKANHLEITRLVIECKNELERVREQVQNVE